MRPIGVLQVIDSLAAGGAERVAVNIANELSRSGVDSHLCATRAGGPLEDELDPGVRFFTLGRRGRFDLGAIVRLRSYVRDHGIRILHAHSSSVFIAAAAKRRSVGLLWHDHVGRHGIRERSSRLYRPALARCDGVVSVSLELRRWVTTQGKVPPEKTWLLHNFVSADPSETNVLSPDLAGVRGGRVVCVANLRPQKDHAMLLRAFERVVAEFPPAHLLLVGGIGDPTYERGLRAQVGSLSLVSHVTFLGARSDVASILRACDVGVLSSASEGFPLALVEYGRAGLPAIATDVGECAEVLDHGAAGIVIPPGRDDLLAGELLRLLRDPSCRQHLGDRLHRRVSSLYSADTVMAQLTKIYDTVLQRSCRPS